MKAKTRNFLVGVTVLAALLIFAWFCLQFGAKATTLIGMMPAETQVEIQAPRVDGLSEGSPVTYQGVVVGRVTQLARNPNGLGVKVLAKLQTNPPIPLNINAEIVMTSLIGSGASVGLELKQTKAGVDQAPEIPPPGAAYPTITATYVGLKILPAEYSKTANQITSLAESITAITQEVHDKDLIQHLDAAVQNVSAQATQAGDLLKSIQELVNDPAMRSDLRQTIANAKKASDDLDRFTANDLPKLSQQASGIMSDAHGTILDTQQKIDDVSKHLTASLVQASALLDSIHSVSEKINTGQGTAGMLLNDPKLYQALVENSRELNANLLVLQRLLEQWEQEGLSLKLK
jgi:phospholipid/cholesterol/gamma-HCH transport system substrate-binding protein